MSDNIRILIADDHAVVRRGLRALIDTEPDMEVVGEASDGVEAVEQASQHKPDVILLDIVMPRKSGLEAIAEIKRENPEARILILTSFAEDDKVLLAIKSGALGYLLKDSSPDELVEAIKTVHEGRAMLQPVIATRLIERMSSEEASGLSKRELEVVSVIASGAQNKEISNQLSLSINTVKFHVANVFRKLGVQNRTEAVRIARERGLLND